MTPMDLNATPFVEEQHDQHNIALFGSNHHVVSSSSVSCNYFFNSTQDHVDHYSQESYKPKQQQEDDNYTYRGGSYTTEDKVDSGLKLTLWKNENPSESVLEDDNTSDPVKWMSSKMRLMQKMKNSDRASLKITSSGSTGFENHQKQPSSSPETDLSSNSTSLNNNSPIRVCADCNTTKTPLWRSGPKGPKTLCNACGIRQRKARRAMAAAAAADAALAAEPSPMKIKVHHKEKTSKSGHASQLKKRCKVAAGPSNDKKLGNFEDFLINLSNNLAFNRMFPQDEKDAAILLMALSSGLVHG